MLVYIIYGILVLAIASYAAYKESQGPYPCPSVVFMLCVGVGSLCSMFVVYGKQHYDDRAYEIVKFQRVTGLAVGDTVQTLEQINKQKEPRVDRGAILDFGYGHGGVQCQVMWESGFTTWEDADSIVFCKEDK